MNASIRDLRSDNTIINPTLPAWHSTTPSANGHTKSLARQPRVQQLLAPEPIVILARMGFFLFQKRPDGDSKWEDEEGRVYNFSKGLPRATRVSKNDRLLFYRPVKAGTPEDGCIYATASVGLLEIDGKNVLARLRDYVSFGAPVPLSDVGDPRDNQQHSLQPVSRDWFESVLRRAGLNEGVSEGG